jgi:hypothetical protein
MPGDGSRPISGGPGTTAAPPLSRGERRHVMSGRASCPLICCRRRIGSLCHAPDPARRYCAAVHLSIANHFEEISL